MLPMQWFLNVVRLDVKHANTLRGGNSFTSNVTNRKYDVVTPNNKMDCSTKNVIYLISCKKCGIQYVGETSQMLFLLV